MKGIIIYISSIYKKFNNFLICVLLFSFFQLISADGITQNKITDSLRTKLYEAKNEKDKLACYCNLGWEWYSMNADTAIFYANKGLQSATALNNVEELACNYNILGLSYFRKRLYKQSLDYFTQSLALYKTSGNKKNAARLSMNISDVYLNKANYKDALQYSLSALEQAEKNNDSILISSIHRSVSIIYRSMENYKKAEEHILKSFDYADANNGQTKGKSTLASAYSSYGILLRLMKEYEKSIALTKKSIKSFREEGDEYNAALCIENLAETYFDTKQIKTAIHYYSEAMQVFIKLESPVDEGYELNNIAACENELKEYDNALAHLARAANIFTENKTDNYLMETHKLMSAAYDSLDNTAKAFDEYKKYITIKDTLESQEQRDKLLQLQTEYETVENEKKIADLKNEKLLQEQRLKQNSIITLIMAVVIGLLIFTGLVLRNRYKLKQKLKFEEIRNKIASDLHDDVGSTLSSIRIYSDIVKSQPSQTPTAKTLLDKISSNSKEMIENMSDIVWMIKPGNDDFKSIENRMQNFANEICVPAAINFEFIKNGSADDIKMPMEMRRDLYLIFKEAVNNAVKYSGCHFINASLKFSNNQLQMRISDDGKGFDMHGIKNGNGLSNMQTRTTAHDGSFSIYSSPGEGTEITIAFNV